MFKSWNFSYLDDEFLVKLELEVELMLSKVRAQKAQLIPEQEENLKRMHHHIGGGIRFKVILIDYGKEKEKMQYLEVDLKDVLLSGLPAVSCVKGIKCEDIPIDPGVCRVGDALFMVGGNLNESRVNKRETKWLWSAPVPPIASGGCLNMTWTRCDTCMHSGRSLPMVVPLRDGRVFICGGTSKPECWVEIYDPEKGEFDRRDLPDYDLDHFPSSCFLWDDQSVMLYYDNVDEFAYVSNPSLFLYDVERNNWELFADNLPTSKYPDGEKRNIVYVGGNILFVIEQASCWTVYDLSAKKEVRKVDVKVKDGKVMQALYLGNNDVKSTTSWIFYIFLPNVENRNYIATNYSDLRYAKVEVVQGKDGDYSAVVQFTGVLKIGGFDDLYIIADEVSLKRFAEEDRVKEREEDDK